MRTSEGRSADPLQCRDAEMANRRSSRRSRRRSTLDIQIHEPLGHELHHLAQHGDVGSLLGKLGQCDS